MVDAIEEEACDLGIKIYRERRFRDKVVLGLSVEGKPYFMSFTVRERPNRQVMDIIGKLTIGAFESENMHIFGVYTRSGEYGGSLKITSSQNLEWEIHTEIRNKEHVQSYFLRILRTFSSKIEEIHKVWSAYTFSMRYARVVREHPATKALE